MTRTHRRVHVWVWVATAAAVVAVWIVSRIGGVP
jgi:hypothetical protein